LAVAAAPRGRPRATGGLRAAAHGRGGARDRPVPLNVRVGDPRAPGDAETAAARVRPPSEATVPLHKFRGPGKVTFDKPRVMVAKQGDMVTSSATFAAPGEYTLRVQANDESGEGGFGFQCCWTNTYVRVTVK